METAQLEALATSPAALAAAFVLGTLWGSFANVCIYRWPPSPEHPHGQSVVTPGSRCGACGKPVRWYDNVPILAWLWLRGRCRDCGTQFSARYLLVEALTGLLFATVWWFAVDARAALEPLDLRVVRAAIGAAFAWTMVVVIFIDLDHMLILDRLTLPSLAGFYALGVVLPERTWTDGLIGAAVGLALVRVVADLFLLLRGKHGLGMGDGKLLAVVGALLGWKGPVVALFGGAAVAVVVVVPAMLVRGALGRGAGADGAADGEGEDGADGADADAAPPPVPWAERRLALWSLAAVAVAVTAVLLTPLPPWIAALALVALALADDLLGLTDGPEPADARAARGDEPAAGVDQAHQADDDLAPGALPFGPFLAVTALFWWFAEPYVMFRLGL
ncbi:MAG: prepilin peptidase [Kofleriaceae bacterium]|nr:prepilin peptidase [Kofleriaceae bacterium]MCL4223973.1 A24 family peptidase [Myxococcales bacterium]